MVLYKQLVTDSCDEYRHYIYQMSNVVNTETNSTSCPACPVSEKNIKVHILLSLLLIHAYLLQPDGNIFISMDGCFSLVKRRADVTNIQPLHQNTMFLNQAEVDEFVQKYGTKQNGLDTRVSNALLLVCLFYIITQLDFLYVWTFLY